MISIIYRTILQHNIVYKNYQFSILFILTLSITLISVADFAFAQQFEVTTYVGGDIPGYVDGNISSAAFNGPLASVLAPNGDLYVVDSTNHAIRIVYANGTVATYAGDGSSIAGSNDGTSSNASFSSPTNLALDANGDLYVVDSSNHKIRIIYVNGTVDTYAGKGGYGTIDGDALDAQFARPNDVALAPNGDLYVSDSSGNTIRIIYKNKTVATYAGNGIAGYNDTDALNAQFNIPTTLALAPNGDLYVADSSNDRIRIIYTNKTVATYAGNGTPGFNDTDALNAQFDDPYGIALAPNGDLYVTDKNNYKIRIIYANKTVDTIAGNGTEGLKNGNALNVPFGILFSIELAPNGDIYVASSTGNRIAKLTLNRTLGDSWTTRQQIDINSSQIPSTLTDFTVLISMTSPNLNSSAVQSNGNDIRFTSSDGVGILDHEIESFSNDDTGGSLVAWVRIPTLSNSSTTSIFIYYNVSDAPARLSYSTWDSNYEIIYHMNQSTFGADSTLDSTSNNRHATPMDNGNATFNSSDISICSNWKRT